MVLLNGTSRDHWNIFHQEHPARPAVQQKIAYWQQTQDRRWSLEYCQVLCTTALAETNPSRFFCFCFLSIRSSRMCSWPIIATFGEGKSIMGYLEWSANLFYLALYLSPGISGANQQWLFCRLLSPSPQNQFISSPCHSWLTARTRTVPLWGPGCYSDKSFLPLRSFLLSSNIENGWKTYAPTPLISMELIEIKKITPMTKWWKGDVDIFHNHRRIFGR